MMKTTKFYTMLFLVGYTIGFLSCNSQHDLDNLMDYPFSVSETKKVIFSPSNLQYKASSNEWRFKMSLVTMFGHGKSHGEGVISG